MADLDALVNHAHRRIARGRCAAHRRSRRAHRCAGCAPLLRGAFSKAFHGSPMPMAIQPTGGTGFLDVDVRFSNFLGAPREAVLAGDTAFWVDNTTGSSISDELTAHHAVRDSRPAFGRLMAKSAEVACCGGESRTRERALPSAHPPGRRRADAASRRNCARPRRWKPSDGSPRGSRTTSTTSSPSFSATPHCNCATRNSTKSSPRSLHQIISAAKHRHRPDAPVAAHPRRTDRPAPPARAQRRHRAGCRDAPPAHRRTHRDRSSTGGRSAAGFLPMRATSIRS